jgi:hypothetical protein
MAFFQNRNVCKTFNMTLSAGAKAQLSSQECSEVIIKVSPTTGDNANIFDSTNPSVPWVLAAGQEFTFRGVTNSNQLSAGGVGTLYYRTQYFGSMTDL